MLADDLDVDQNGGGFMYLETKRRVILLKSLNLNKYSHLGVALLEVMLAITVVGIGLGVAFQTFSLGTRTQSRLEKRAIGRQLAEKQVALLSGQGVSAGQKGKFDKPFEQYSWSSEWFAPQNPDLSFSVLRVTVLRGEESKAVYRLDALVSTP